ncbi:MAG: hypothetical protein ACTSQI_02390 [Candidatus Helarchaeota archaeon]
MAVGRVRAILIIALFAGSTAIPILMETSIVPMINLMDFLKNFIEIDEDTNEIVPNFENILNSIQSIACIESDENHTVIELTMNVTNKDPYEFDMLFPGLDMTVYWKAGLPYRLEKETILGWIDKGVNDSNWQVEPDYRPPTQGGNGEGRRWTRVIGIDIDPLRIKPHQERDLKIRLTLYNDQWTPGESNALGQMIGTILRTMSTKDPYTNETLLHVSGSASLDIPLTFPLSLDLGIDLSSFLNMTELLGGMGGDSNAGGSGSGTETPSLFDLLFDVPLNLFDIQNYNDSNQNFLRDALQFPNGTYILDSKGRKQWTEELYQNGALSTYIFMDLKNNIAMQGLNITLLKSTHNPDDPNVNKTWEPWIGPAPAPKRAITNQIFLYIPESDYLVNPNWGDRIFGLFGFTSDQHYRDLPGTSDPKDFGEGRVIAGGTLRLTGDIRENSEFSIGDGVGALITQAIDGMLPIGVFGSVDLMLNMMPLSLCLNMPLELNLSSLLTDLMGGGEGEEEGGGDFFSMLMSNFGLDHILLNGLAFDTYESIVQLDFNASLNMFQPYGIYMPDEVTYDENGEAIPYLGIGGGPLQIYDEAVPEELNGKRFVLEYTEAPTIVNETNLLLSRGNVTEILRVYNESGNATHDWWDENHPSKYFNETGEIYIDTSLNNDSFLANYTNLKVTYKVAVMKYQWLDEHMLLTIPTLDSPTLKESLATLMASIGSSDNGDGIAYVFDDNPDNDANKHGNLLSYLSQNDMNLPDSDLKETVNIADDQLKLALSEIVPNFGNGIYTLLENIGIDPLFIEYINNSFADYYENGQYIHNDSQNFMQDLLSVHQMLDLLYQDGPKNDLFDYLLDSNRALNETADIIDGQTLQVAHWGLKNITNLYNSTSYYWMKNGLGITNYTFWDNGTIWFDTNGSNPFDMSGPIQIEYIANKLELFDVSNLIGAIMNLTMTSGDTSSGGGGGVSTDILSEILRYLPGTLDAMGIDFDRIIPDLIKYLRINISQPEPVGYGIKPFEMMDVAFSSMGGGGADGNGGTDTLSNLLGGLSSDFIDNLMQEVVYRFIEQADPFQLMHATVGDLTPILDYLERSQLFSREVLIPLVSSLFPSGSELEGVGEESFDLSQLIDIIMPLVSEMLVGGDDAAFPHGALNPFAWLSAPECIQYRDLDDIEYSRLDQRDYSIYQVGTGNYTPDYPPYNFLRLWSNVTLGLVMSGFKAEDLWNLIDMMGIFGDDSGGGSSDPFAGFDSLIKLLGAFCPPTEWLGIFREIGIWSTWTGESSIYVGPILGFLGPWEFGGLIGPLLNLEKFLAIGYAQGLLGQLDEWLFGFPFGIMENQSYGLPYGYTLGYDSSHNTGPYRSINGMDNWGWVPLGWDPGGFWPNGYHSPPFKVGDTYYPPIPGGSGYGDPTNNYVPYGGSDYAKSTITRLAAALPLQFDIYLPDFVFDTSLIGIPISLFLAVQLYIYLRLEGNPSMLVSVFEDEGTPLLGIAGHFVGGDLAGLIKDMLVSLGGGGGGEPSNETSTFPDLDLIALLQGFLNAQVDILHLWKYLVDPDFMKASDWYVDSGYVNAFGNTSNPTLIWDNEPGFGDSDEIPDEYPWYRFLEPIYNQDPSLVNVGPGYTPDAASRTPDIVDELTPDGPPGSGIWAERADGVPDGIQHYWYDTPYCYANTTVRLDDPWVNIDPMEWNQQSGTTLTQVNATHSSYNTPLGIRYARTPLLRTIDGKGIKTSAWESTNIPTLYYVSSGPGVIGSPIPIGTTTVIGNSGYPNIWLAFNITLTQTDYRFGFWDNSGTTNDTYWHDMGLGKSYKFLDTKTFYDLLSYAFYPQLENLLDMLDVASLFQSTGAAPALGDVATSLGVDYYHLLHYDDVYSKFGINKIQPLNPLSMLQWLWDGAGEHYNGSQTVPYIEPYTVPNFQGMIDWLADHGFTMDFLITNLGKITDLLAGEVESGEGGTTNVLSDLFSTESIVGMVNAIEEYMIEIVAHGNQTKAAMIVLNIMKDMMSILDIYPVKAIRGALNYLMPRLTESQSSGGTSGVTDVNNLDLGTFLDQSGLLDIIFKNASKMNDLKFTVGIYNSSIDLYLFGQVIKDVPLEISFDLDLGSLLSGEITSGEESAGEASSAGFMSSLPISFPESGFPYIELSTFQGPFDVTFQLYNTSLSGGADPIDNTNVVIGEIWYNETTGVYYLNRTQSSYEFISGISGWMDSDSDGIFRTYVRPNSEMKSNGTGYVTYSSVIEEDNFGWVDPYIYIHVEEPVNYPANTFYWWNVTGHPYQRTLTGNRPAYKAKWVDDGSNIIVQTRNTLPSDCIDIDGDPNWEIFARVEIDGAHMPVQDVVYVKTGKVSDIQVTPFQVAINSSYTEMSQQWAINQRVDATKYILSDEITPSGRAITYPSITDVITGFQFHTNNWNDDSLYSLDIRYYNLTDDENPLYSWRLPEQLGADSGLYTYGGNNSPPIWLLFPSPSTYLTFNFSPTFPAEHYGDFRYAKVDIDAANFTTKTIKSVSIDINVTNNPYEGAGSPYWIAKYLDYDFAYTVPSTTTYYFHQDTSGSSLNIQGFNDSGVAPLEQKQAKWAWFNYTIELDKVSFLNKIWWNLSALENGDAIVTNVIVTYYNATNQTEYTLYSDTPNTPTNSHLITMWEDLTQANGGFADEWWYLYLTARGDTPMENVTSVTFAARIEETNIGTNGGIGYSNGDKIFNTSAVVNFLFYPFVTKWGITSLGDDVEIPEGFISDFDVQIQMFDPLNGINTTALEDYPYVNITYYKMGPMTDSADVSITQNFFAEKIIFTLEAWDSLVRLGGYRGDILYQDNQTSGTQRLVPLTAQPSLNTSITVVDVEGKAYINVTINPDQTLRNFYLNMGISPANSYEGRPYTSNYRFSVISNNFEAVKRIGAYASKKVLNESIYNVTSELQVGIVDLPPYPSHYYIYYILTFEVSPEFLINSATETFHFNAVWEKAAGTYEVRVDKNTTVERTIDITYP